MTHVLLVDDDANVRQSLEQALLKENFRVVAAATSQEAIQQFGEKRVDIVLLDLNLGKENGWDTVEKLRKIRPRLPVIVMTGQPEQVPSSAKAKSEIFMEKPLDLPALFQKLIEMTLRPDAPSPACA
jgi:two-component system nitrogen regulation response regulator NtrX